MDFLKHNNIQKTNKSSYSIYFAYIAQIKFNDSAIIVFGCADSHLLWISAINQRHHHQSLANYTKWCSSLQICESKSVSSVVLSPFKFTKFTLSHITKLV